MNLRVHPFWSSLSRLGKLSLVALIVMASYGGLTMAVYAVGATSCGSGSFSNVLVLPCYTGNNPSPFPKGGVYYRQDNGQVMVNDNGCIKAVGNPEGCWTSYSQFDAQDMNSFGENNIQDMRVSVLANGSLSLTYGSGFTYHYNTATKTLTLVGNGSYWAQTSANYQSAYGTYKIQLEGGPAPSSSEAFQIVRSDATIQTVDLHATYSGGFKGGIDPSGQWVVLSTTDIALSHVFFLFFKATGTP